jgi:hypothetical protein
MRMIAEPPLDQMIVGACRVLIAAGWFAVCVMATSCDGSGGVYGPPPNFLSIGNSKTSDVSVRGWR